MRLRGKVESAHSSHGCRGSSSAIEEEEEEEEERDRAREREQAWENKESLPPSLLHDYFFFLMKIEEDGLAN